MIYLWVKCRKSTDWFAEDSDKLSKIRCGNTSIFPHSHDHWVGLITPIAGATFPAKLSSSLASCSLAEHFARLYLKFCVKRQLAQAWRTFGVLGFVHLRVVHLASKVCQGVSSICVKCHIKALWSKNFTSKTFAGWFCVSGVLVQIGTWCCLLDLAKNKGLFRSKTSENSSVPQSFRASQLSCSNSKGRRSSWLSWLCQVRKSFAKICKRSVRVWSGAGLRHKRLLLAQVLWKKIIRFVSYRATRCSTRNTLGLCRCFALLPKTHLQNFTVSNASYQEFDCAKAQNALLLQDRPLVPAATRLLGSEEQEGPEPIFQTHRCDFGRHFVTLVKSFKLLRILKIAIPPTKLTCSGRKPDAMIPGFCCCFFFSCGLYHECVLKKPSAVRAFFRFSAYPNTPSLYNMLAYICVSLWTAAMHMDSKFPWMPASLWQASG